MATQQAGDPLLSQNKPQTAYSNIAQRVPQFIGSLNVDPAPVQPEPVQAAAPAPEPTFAPRTRLRTINPALAKSLYRPRFNPNAGNAQKFFPYEPGSGQGDLTPVINEPLKTPSGDSLEPAIATPVASAPFTGEAPDRIRPERPRFLGVAPVSAPFTKGSYEPAPAIASTRLSKQY